MNNVATKAVFLLSLAIAPLAFADALDSQENPDKEVVSQRIVPAQPERPIGKPSVPRELRAGWVIVTITISETGSVSDVTVYRSTGNKSLEESAIRHFRKTRWKPATKEGTPVESRKSFRVNLDETDSERPSRTMQALHSELIKAVDIGDRAKATELLSNMAKSQRINSADFVLISLGRYVIARKWGDAGEQYDALSDALEGGKRSFSVFSPQLYEAVQKDKFALEVTLGRHGDAENTFSRFTAKAKTEPSYKAMQQVIEQLSASKARGESNKITLRLSDRGSDRVALSRYKFSVLSGEDLIHSLRLDCGDVALPIELRQDFLYAIENTYAKCFLSVSGTPNAIVVIEERI